MRAATDNGTRHITVRLSSATRHALNDLAERSDRTLSQLARYAIAAYSPNAKNSPISSTHCHLTPEDDAKPLGMRLPSSIMDDVEKMALKYDVTPSSIIRVALDTWLTTSGPRELGTPPNGSSAMMYRAPS